jgi:Mg2+ and Co2+ transporter CorA
VVEPCKYSAQIEADSQTQTFEILKDPTTKATLADIKEQVAFSLQLRESLNKSVKMINELETQRKKIGDAILKMPDSPLKNEAKEWEKKATEIANQLYDINLTGAREDAFRNPMQVYERLQSLASDIGANGSDFKPTNQQRQVYDVLKTRLNKAQTDFDMLLKKPVL